MSQGKERVTCTIRIRIGDLHGGEHQPYRERRSVFFLVTDHEPSLP